MNLVIGDKAKFHYLKQPVNDDDNPQLVNQVATSEVYFGEVVEIFTMAEWF